MTEKFCGECETWVPEDRWIETSSPCELCGEHGAEQCPHCGERYDLVYDKREERGL